MADSHHRQVATLSSPLRLARKPLLNTIMEASEYSPKEDSPREPQSVRHGVTRESLHSIQIAMSFSPETARRISTPAESLSSTSSSCSDEEWQQGLRPFDDLYDASDDDERECPSLTESRPSSLATMSIRSSTYSTNSRNRYPSLMIPTASLWPSLVNPHKSSPVPPTPPPKIPVSPATLSMLPGNVPALHAPPSLDGSLSSDQISNISSPATPDLRPVRDHNWDTDIIRVRQDSNAPSSAGASSTDLNADEERAIETGDDWNPLIDSFPAIPSRFESQEPAVLSLDISYDQPVSARSDSPGLNGIMLPPAAIATLQHIPLDQTPGPWSEISEKNDEMWQLSAPPTNRHQRSSPPPDATPESELSGYSFTNLSIPSPGGFFSSLDPKSRYTWSLPSAIIPPTSAVAARFYDVPWSQDQGEVVEHVVEVSADESLADDQPTAVPVTAIRIPSAQHTRSDSHDSTSPVVADVQELDRSGVPAYEYDEAYDDELKRQAVANLDRTSVWLAAQHSYLSALSETNPVNEVAVKKEIEPVDVEDRPTSSSSAAVDSPPRKSVRFSETVQELTISPLPPPPDASKDSIYWRGFQFVLQQSRRRDVFLHSDIRFDAIQSVRLGFPQKHRTALLGKFELEAPERPGYKGPFSQAPRKSVLAEVLADQALYSNLEKEQMVLSQIYQSVWAVDAMRFLNGGRLLSRPATKRLSIALKQMAKPSPQPGPKRRLRVLDLGGQATCGWAWQVAHDYPDVKIYTVVGKHQEVNSHIKGPINHRRVSVPCLWKLPFRNNQFDVISARSLHALLKTERPAGEDSDEYDLCLKECYRCLKPGGYLEFFTMDSSIARAGPLGTAASVEFTFNLKTRGYDPSPTRSFLSRLQRSNFADIKRAWMFLPMGIEPTKPEPMRETPNPRVKSQIDCEAIQGPVGSTGDVASMTGLLGGWMWEQWLLKTQMEMGREEKELLKDIGGVFDEGRKLNAGWTCLSGWAMKPRRGSQQRLTVMSGLSEGDSF
ncbi:uncharacterized protein BHQ10_009849 [Talaromyces amestolkiae]|uniref:Methyltransferase type 11 domain-containing protein n=1 Tax=Talaromyces amestolkiae TaxID=1196081 RepID=A0A364LDG3_TALAM|nr:uncharacterized protein BHQ10_009849 [Talaromyces amestolkiae]RAO73837.1 hypothetical protein BHQ10_009849 [Talaromyces amestolkiae]